ncbi:nSTAND1 domain-containing NTPase [Rhizobium johnstonii]
MSRIFISHSSEDNFEAVALSDWLAAEGWNDVFLDIDPNRGIVGGERWERAIHQAATRCEAVIFVITTNWLASGWCMREYALARGLNKKLFAVIVDPVTPTRSIPNELKGTWQVVDLSAGNDLRLVRSVLPGSHEEKHVGFSETGLRRLKLGLEKAGLDPRFFQWPPKNDPARIPYRGLRPLEAVDAGIFFGREASIVEAMDRLRGLRDAAAPRLLVILGASGAGKSSFLRAGLLPRLERDDINFLPLPVIRPERAPLYGERGLLSAFEAAVPNRPRATIRVAIQSGLSGVQSLLAEIVEISSAQTLLEDQAARPPTVIISIDQAEELFRGEVAEEGASLLALLRDLAAKDKPPVIVVFAIRSDAYDALEHAKAFAGMPQATLPLLPMPQGSYKEIIEGPSRRFTEAGGKLLIEPQLTMRLLDDLDKAGGSDTLPLLAFTLEQLFLENRGASTLRLSDYETFGGLKGVIDAAVKRAFARADTDPRIPSDRAARETLVRRGLIPWLAGIDPDSKSPRRNIARRSDIPAEAKPLVDLLIEERLLTTDRKAFKDPETGAESQIVTIEPSHEVLLRQWGLLEGWLQDDLGLLTTLEGVKRGARDWQANLRSEAWIAHRGQRLSEALALDARPDIAARLDVVDRAYMAACRDREESLEAEADQRRKERQDEQARRLSDAQKLATSERRAANRMRIGFIVVLFFAAIASILGGVAIYQKSLSEIERNKAEAALWLSQSQSELRSGNIAQAVESAHRAMDAMPSKDTRSGLLAALASISPHLLGSLDISPAGVATVTWAEEDTANVATGDGRLRFISVASPQHRPQWMDATVEPFRSLTSSPIAIQKIPNGDVLTLYDDATVSLVREQSKIAEVANPGSMDKIAALAHSASIGLTGKVLAFATLDDRLVSLRCDWNAIDQAKICLKKNVANLAVKAGVQSVAISPDELTIAFSDRTGIIHLCDIELTACDVQSASLGGKILSLSWSTGGQQIAAGTQAGDVVILDRSLRDIGRAAVGQAITDLAWRPISDQLIAVCAAKSVCLLKFSNGGALDVATRFVGHRDKITRLAWSPQGSAFVSIGDEGQLLMWSVDQDRSVVSSLPPCGAGLLSMIDVSPDHLKIAGGGDGGVLCLWSISDHRLAIVPGTNQAKITALAWNKRQEIAALREDGTLDVLSAATGRVTTLATLPIEPFSRIAWGSDDQTIVATISDGRVAFLNFSRPTASAQTGKFLPDSDGASGIAVRPSSGEFFLSYTNSKLGVIDPHTLTLLTTIDSPPSYSGSLAVSPAGQLLAATGSDFEIGLYDLSQNRLTQKLSIDIKETHSVAFSPDGSKLAAFSAANNNLYVWDMLAPRPLLLEKLDLAHIGLFSSSGAHASWIAWLSSSTIAAAMSEGTVAIIDLDESKWVERIHNLGLQ